MSNMTDVIGGNNLYGGTRYSFVADRFNNSNSAIFFNNGYLEVPSGVYFYGDFTFITWIYLQSYASSWTNIFDFARPFGSNSVNMILYQGSELSGYISSSSISKSVSFQLNTWYHVAFVLSGTTGYLYVNGILINSKSIGAPSNVVRTKNYIGNSNTIYSNALAVYDDIKIYQGALSSSCIMNDYLQLLNSKFLY
jgi:hypothetical protein